jgi:acetylglutamate/LysW-gamma-L-alpha-aminoadipate kinase
MTSPDGQQRARYTDPVTLDTLTLAMLGRVKPRLVAELARLGVPAVGISGIDGGLVTATPTPPVRARVADGQLRVVRDDMTGRVAAIDAGLLELLLGRGYVPVISPPVLGTAGQPLSTDADRLAAQMATALSATWLIVLSNVPGLLRDPADEATVIPRIPLSEIDEYMSVASGRMRVKLRAVAEAARAGVGHVVLADGRRDGPVLAARLGAGTTILAEGLS